jgi:hypothetical protein
MFQQTNRAIIQRRSELASNGPGASELLTTMLKEDY